MNDFLGGSKEVAALIEEVGSEPMETGRFNRVAVRGRRATTPSSVGLSRL